MSVNTIVQIVCAVIQIFFLCWSLAILHNAKKIREKANEMLQEAKSYWERMEM